MSVPHGSGAFYETDDAGGTPTDISAFVTSVDWPKSKDVARTDGFQSTAKTYVAESAEGGTITLNGMWDPVVDALMDARIGISQTERYGPDGDTAGDVRYTAEAILGEYSGPQAGLDGAVTFTASYTVNGLRTRDLFP